MKENGSIINLSYFSPPKPVPSIPGYVFKAPSVAYRAHGFPNETNDCTVRAAMSVLRLDYPSAHELLRRAGRKDRKGFHIRKVAKAAGLQPLGINRGSVRGVLSRLPGDGRYVVKVRHHVFAVADGRIFDYPEQANRHVKEVYRVAEMDDYQI